MESLEPREWLNALIWLQPDDPDHQAKLDRACGRIAAVAITSPDFAEGEPPFRSAADEPAIDEVVVLSWNTYLGRGRLSEVVDGLVDGRFTGGKPVGTYVLLLQEVFRSQILAFARARKLHAVYAPARLRDGDQDDRGAAILSTIRLQDILVAELPFEKQRRIALGASFEGRRRGGDEWQLRLVNVHLDTAVGILRGGPSASRRRQARALIEALSAWPAPLVLAGDFNTWWGDDEPAVKELRRTFPDADRIAARETWRGPLGTGNKLDYVFAKGFSPPLAVRRLDRRFGSDHWPLLTTVPTR